jgi:hypothetical protein
MPEPPKVDVELINRPDEKPLDAGEASQGSAVAAIANAFTRPALDRRVVLSVMVRQVPRKWSATTV